MTAPAYDRSVAGVWGGAWGRPVAVTARDVDAMIGRIVWEVRQAAQADLIDILKQAALTEADLRTALWYNDMKDREIAQLRAYINEVNVHMNKMTPLAGVQSQTYPSSVPPMQPAQYQSPTAARYQQGSRVAATMVAEREYQQPPQQLPPAPSAPPAQ